MNVDLSEEAPFSIIDTGVPEQGMEKLLLERLLARKDLRLTAMQEKVQIQSIN